MIEHTGISVEKTGSDKEVESCTKPYLYETSRRNRRGPAPFKFQSIFHNKLGLLIDLLSRKYDVQVVIRNSNQAIPVTHCTAKGDVAIVIQTIRNPFLLRPTACSVESCSPSEEHCIEVPFTESKRSWILVLNSFPRFFWVAV